MMMDHDDHDDRAASRVEAVRLSTAQRAVLTVAGLLVLATTVTGPYLALLQSHYDGQQIKEIRRSEAVVQQSQAGIQQLLDFVAKSQSGPQAQANLWYAQELRAICAGLPGCRQAPMPPGLAGQLLKPTSPPTSAPPSTSRP